MSDICQRCSRVLSDKEQAYISNNQVICSECHGMEQLIQRPKPVPYHSAMPPAPTPPVPSRPIAIPSYYVLRFVAGVHEVLGWVLVALSVVLFLLLFAGGAASRNSGAMAMAAGIGLVQGITLGFTGLALVAFAQLLYCVRDIARNSFRAAGTT